jgi:predicted kinase
MRMGLPTVVDTTGLRSEQRTRFVEIAQKHQRPIVLVICDVDPDEAWSRNVARSQQGGRFVPEEAFQWQIEQLAALKEELVHEADIYHYHDVLFVT